MANKKFWLGILVMIPVFGLFFSGCATNLATTKGTFFDIKPMNLIGVPKYTVLGTVTLEKNWFGILGFSTPPFVLPFAGTISGNDFYLYRSGGVTYADLLAEARKQYMDADAVIDINIDFLGSLYAIFYSQRRYIVSGIAIKYSRDEVDYPNKSNPQSSSE